MVTSRRWCGSPPGPGTAPSADCLYPPEVPPGGDEAELVEKAALGPLLSADVSKGSLDVVSVINGPCSGPGSFLGLSPTMRCCPVGEEMPLPVDDHHPVSMLFDMTSKDRHGPPAGSSSSVRNGVGCLGVDRCVRGPWRHVLGLGPDFLLRSPGGPISWSPPCGRLSRMHRNAGTLQPNMTQDHVITVSTSVSMDQTHACDSSSMRNPPRPGRLQKGTPLIP
jgi:hypothetical protein